MYTYTCIKCDHTAVREKFIKRVLSIVFHPAHEEMRAFVSVVCPQCGDLIIIEYDFFSCKTTKRSE